MPCAAFCSACLCFQRGLALCAGGFAGVIRRRVTLRQLMMAWACGLAFSGLAQSSAALQTIPQTVPQTALQTIPTAVRVCVQAIDYYPHYDFAHTPARGFAPELLTRFFQHAGIAYQWVALPIKRVYRSGECDLIYPDNPNWHAHEELDPRHYSAPLTTIIGSTLVRQGEANRSLESIDAIAVPRGFTPDHLLKLQQAYRFKLVETPDANAALQMLLKKRVDAVDVEWHVARHLLRELRQADAAEQGSQLPTVHIGFHVSTLQKTELLAQLNQFLHTETTWVQALTLRYQLTPTAAVTPKQADKP